MSRSRKKPVWKDKSNHVWYNRIVRRVQRMQVKQIASLNDILEYEISQPNELINDWMSVIGSLIIEIHDGEIIILQKS